MSWPTSTPSLQKLVGPSSLVGLDSALFTLSEIAKYVSELEESPRDLAAELTLVVESLPREPPFPISTFGDIGSYPLYAALAVQPKVPEARDSLRRLQAVALVCYRLIHDLPDDHAAKPTLAAAGLAIRRFHQPAMSEKLLPLFSQDCHSLIAVQSLLSRALSSDDKHQADAQRPPRHVEHIQALLRLVELANRTRSLRSVSTVTRAVVVRRDRSAEEPSRAEFEVINGLPARAQRAKVDAGASPERESPHIQTFGISLVDPGIHATSSPRTKNQERIHQKRALRTQFQKLPIGLDRLQNLDLHYLLGALSQTSPKNGSFKPGKVNDELTGLIVLSSLLTGCNVSTLQSSTVVWKFDAHAATYSRTSRATLCIQQKCWLLQPPKIKGAFTPKAEETGFYEATGRIVLPLPRGIGAVRRLFDYAKQRRGQLLFPLQSTEDWQRDIDGWLARRSRGTPSRLSRKRIESFLSSRFLDASHDKAEAGLFADDVESSGAAARMYYHAPSAQLIVDRYRSIFDDAVKGHNPAFQIDWPWKSLTDDSLIYAANAARVGSKGVAKLDVVREAVENLRRKVEHLRSGRPWLTRVIAFHNAYVAYIALMVMWHTGIRAVIDPIEFSLLDLDAGLLAVADKDFEEEATPRLVPLSTTAQEQLRHYVIHRERFVAYLRGAGIPIEPDRWLFFLDKMRFCEVRPESLAKQLGPDYPFRMNSQRHFIRTRLLDLGARPWHVDALLGHGALGEEPYGPYSCFDFSVYVETLRPQIEALSELVGWSVVKPIEGLGSSVSAE